MGKGASYGKGILFGEHFVVHGVHRLINEPTNHEIVFFFKKV